MVINISDDDWPFRGRSKELAKLNEIINRPPFYPVRIAGRRRIGKSRLLKELFARRGDYAPVIMINLRGGPDNTFDAAYNSLTEAAANAGIPYDAELLSTLTDRVMRLETLLLSLMENGAVVVLDEFQYAQNTEIEYSVKHAIDNHKVRGHPIPADGQFGTLILTGSHQQQLYEMFSSKRPLYGRISSNVLLKQWTLSTVLEMAADQGLLRYPERFLSMHTALGGMPGAWEDFIKVDPAANLEDWRSDSEWRRAFIAGREAALEGQPLDRWDNAANIELSKENLAVFEHIATTKRGFTTAKISRDLGMERSQVKKSLDMLRWHLNLVEFSEPFIGAEPRWRICDNPARFQLTVLAELSEADRVNRLETLEGDAFERMAAAWLQEMEGVTSSKCGAWMPGLADIDILAEREISGAAAVITGGCKRNPENHVPAKLDEQWNGFMDAVRENERGKRLCGLPHKRLLISPRFPPEVRDRYAGSGYEYIDIIDMARSLGINPDPRPAGTPTTSLADQEILHARECFAAHNREVRSLRQQRQRLEATRHDAEMRLADTEAGLHEAGFLAFRRKRALRERIAAISEEVEAATAGIDSITIPVPPDKAVAAAAERSTEAEKRQFRAMQAVWQMEADGNYFAPRENPEFARNSAYAPDRSLVFVVARDTHVPPEENLARRWHHFAVWQPENSAEPLLTLRHAFPDCEYIPTPEVMVLLPLSFHQVDLPRAQDHLKSWGVTRHINEIEGRVEDSPAYTASPTGEIRPANDSDLDPSP
ncbi:MAG: ATP-binding protein [Rhodobacteraceae bacterium]|nr:ATP-binding protein [Paracoccaceae bacterium]